MGKSRRFTAEFKRQVVEELLSGITRPAQLSRRYSLSLLLEREKGRRENKSTMAIQGQLWQTSGKFLTTADKDWHLSQRPKYPDSASLKRSSFPIRSPRSSKESVSGWLYPHLCTSLIPISAILQESKCPNPELPYGWSVGIPGPYFCCGGKTHRGIRRVATFHTSQKSSSRKLPGTT